MSSQATQPADVIAFWFGELRDGFAADRYRKRWFSASAALDAEIRERFGALLQQARGGELAAWADSPGGAVALVILCDQLSRQIHRGTATAYGTDALALSTARAAIERGQDRQLAFDQRAFLYMPFQHSESRIDQHTSVGLFDALKQATPAASRHHAEGFLRHAREHREIVMRYGRFPHRNGVLGRRSTDEELAFLETASNFGQSAPAR